MDLWLALKSNKTEIKDSSEYPTSNYLTTGQIIGRSLVDTNSFSLSKIAHLNLGPLKNRFTKNFCDTVWVRVSVNLHLNLGLNHIIVLLR